MNKPFNLEDFKNGQKALTRNGQVATFVAICEDCSDGFQLIAHLSGDIESLTYFLDGRFYEDATDSVDLVSMISRHQHLIDSYDPEDTWQIEYGENSWFTLSTGVEPEWNENVSYRLHPHNDLIKAYKKGAKIEVLIDGRWKDKIHLEWYEHTKYRIKPEPTIHCLVYDAKRFDHEQTTAVRARVVKKEVAVANGWKIIQEWEV